MATSLNPYISFRNNAKQALEFYHSVLGGELNVSTFGEALASEDPAEKDLVMHGQVTSSSGLILMVADTPSQMEYNPGDNVAVSLSGDDEAELRGYWEKLADGATVSAPLMQAPWGDTFGMLQDKFGINWMVNIAGAQS